MKYTDKELLDALEKQHCGIAVVHDDAEHWCVATDGFQQVVFDSPCNFSTSYLVPAKRFGRKSIREAIAAFLDDPEGLADATTELCREATETSEGNR